MPIKQFPTNIVMPPALPQACRHLSAIQKTQADLNASQKTQVTLRAIYRRCI